MNRPFRQVWGCAAAAGVLLATPASALDLNSFRAQHNLPPLSLSLALSGEASADAYDLARRNHLDHKASARGCGRWPRPRRENVLWGCDSADCAIRTWAKSAGHRRNMLMKGVSSYGLASATADNGRKYWVLNLGN